ncbi:MAG: HDOD domain-containing protein [Deltaproteobacteria bacterium]|nr:HDOD domain-containing protein [Deltaproteobacteria bacterium]MBW2151893.1 HDOD domain-containing protein [Deltaproteobacteria bacterium]
MKLIKACDDEKTTPSGLARITAVDPSLSSKVLRLVNSSYMGFMSPITSLEKAVIYLGADTIKNIAISASILQVFSRTRGDSSFNLRRFWWHSFMCATLARRIAKSTGYMNPEEAFLCGLLHDIAKLVLWKHFPTQYGRILKESGKDTHQLLKNEKEMGATHAEVGSWLIQKWNLDPFMADAVFYHHVPVNEIIDAFPLVKIVYTANALSQSVEQTIETGAEVTEKVFGFTAAQIEEIESSAKKEVSEVAEALDIPIEPPPDLVQDTVQIQYTSEDLAKEIKNISLLYGTLENLIRADSKEAILRIAEHGLKILFDIKSLFFFLYDPDQELLIGDSPDGNPRIKELTLQVRTQRCLPCTSLAEKRILSSFNRSDIRIPDRQMIQLLGSEGMICLPLYAYQQPIGIIVMGVQSAQEAELGRQQKSLSLFANHVAICFYVDTFKNLQAKRIQAERMEAISSVARKVVHEANNPLGIIKNYLKVLGVKLPERHPAQSDINIISEEIDRVSKIIHQLNCFSQPETKKREAVDINRLLVNLMKLLRKSILKPAGIKDQLSLAPELPRIMADENSLRQVFLNLIKNAAEAMPNGGRLFVKTRYIGHPESHIENAEEELPEKAAIEVIIKDEGQGISDEIKSRLFEPYISTKSGEHRGLGLSIVHNIIKELNGTITCQSDKDIGTQFKVTLPCRQPDANANRRSG